MSTGAVLQLAAYGTQDLYLTGNPQVTHFKSVIRRHTNFAIEAVENYFDGILAPGQKIQCKLQRVGDLVHQIYLKLDLPQLQSFNGVDNIYISWVNAIGYVIIDYIGFLYTGFEVFYLIRFEVELFWFEYFINKFQ